MHQVGVRFPVGPQKQNTPSFDGVFWYNQSMEENKHIVAASGWSWGAFLFSVPFLVGIKKYKMLWWYLLALVPFVNVAFWIIFVVYLGVKGHDLAAKSPQFSHQAEYDGFFKVFDHAGKILVVVVVIILLVFAILSIAGIAGTFFGRFGYHRPF